MSIKNSDAFLDEIIAELQKMKEEFLRTQELLRKKEK